MDENQFARKIIQELEQVPLDHRIASRLAFSRQKAIESLHFSTLQSASSTSNLLHFGFLSFFMKWVSFLFISLSLMSFYPIHDTSFLSPDHVFDFLPEPYDNLDWSE